MDESRTDRSAELKRSAMEILAERLHLSSVTDVRRVMDELVADAMSGRMNEHQLSAFSDVVDITQRVEAIDRPWVFGNRYMSHTFVSTNPICPNCQNAVPHRTMLICPTCGKMGPWVMVERSLPSSYIHCALVEQVSDLVENRLVLPGGDSRADGMVSALPRGGAKSTWLCQIIGLWLLLTGRSRCLLILSNTITQVIERAVEIKEELEDNELIIRDFGVQAASRQEKRIWTQSDFVLANGSRCVARGAMQSMRGVKNKQYRPDVVVSDDSDDEKFMTSADQSRKLLEWWDTRVVPACHPNTIYMFHGTVLGELALLWQTLTGNRGLTFAKLVVKAIQDRPGCSICGMPSDRVGPFDCPVCSAVTTAVSPHSFWGARFTTEALASIKRRIGFWAWQSEYQQEAHDDSTSWFDKEWIDRSKTTMPYADKSERRIIPWSIIANTLSGEEMVELAARLGHQYERKDDRPGPYQLILQCWDPAWARAKPRDQKTCWMCGITVGLTWDDKLDVMFMTRDRGLTSNATFRKWMYDSWIDWGLPAGNVERRGQCGMIIEINGGGVLFQADVEEHWGSVPMIDHQTGTEKHDLEDGIPGLASWYESGRVIVRSGTTDDERALSDELAYELRMSGRSAFTDMLMTLWFGWAYANRWMREVRDPERYNELARRSVTRRH